MYAIFLVNPWVTDVTFYSGVLSSSRIFQCRSMHLLLTPNLPYPLLNFIFAIVTKVTLCLFSKTHMLLCIKTYAFGSLIFCISLFHVKTNISSTVLSNSMSMPLFVFRLLVLFPSLLPCLSVCLFVLLHASTLTPCSIPLVYPLTLTVLVTTIDALRHFETG